MVIQAKSVKSKSVDKKQFIIVLNESIDLVSLMKGYELVADSLEIVIKEFYIELFSKSSDIELLLSENNEADRISTMSSLLRLLFENLQDEEKLQSLIDELAEIFSKYNVDAVLYKESLGIFVGVCKKHVGRRWTKKMTATWDSLLSVILEIVMVSYKNNHSVSDNDMDDVSDQKPSAKINDVLLLESIQDISKSELLKQDILLLIKTSKNIKIDASHVGRVDGSALQLLCGLFIFSKANDIQLSWINPSEAMISAAQYTGMEEQLDLNQFKSIK